MKKILKWIWIPLLGIVLIAIISFQLAFLFAFGPIETTGFIEIKSNKHLKYTEIYSADLADWWYDITFTLDNKIIAEESFKNEDWAKEVKVFLNENQAYILINDSPRVYILTINIKDESSLEESIPLDSFNIEKYRQEKQIGS